MHYAQYKHSDPALARDVVEAFPFAAVTTNGPDGPLAAHAPMTFRDGPTPAGALEFHLARINPIAGLLAPGTPITVLFQGPGAAVSPTWFHASFPNAESDRSRTAPTYSYLSMVVRGRLQFMDDDALQIQIADLVRTNEGANGWRLDELAPDLWEVWRSTIQGYRLEIEYFDLTAKFDTGESPGDRVGIVEGLTARGLQDDTMVARLVQGHDGTPQSLSGLLRSLRVK